ncbi:PepSY domain-containing protein [soil metagenome]
MATVSLPVRPAGQRKPSRLWWYVHHWVGFKLALFMSFVFLTGTLAVVSNEIDWLVQPSLRVSPSRTEVEPNWEKIVASATTYPGIKEIQGIDEPTASAFAAKVAVIWEDGRYGFLHIHPATGAVQGVAPWVGAQRILRNMHRHLNLPVWIGVPIVCTIAFLLLVSLASAFVVYKKWWRGFLKLPRRRDARTWWGDFHRLTGVWSLWFVMLIALTGVWYFVEQMGADAPVPKAEISKDTASLPGDLPAIGRLFQASLQAARAADPELDIQDIRFPTPKSPAFVFEGAKTAILVRSRANAVWTDAGSGRVLARFDGEDLDIHQRISEMADPLHFGTFGGYWTKIPWFLFGALLTGLSVSGVAIYALRIGRELKEATPLGLGVKRSWQGMDRWRWLALALVMTAFMMFPALLAERAG